MASTKNNRKLDKERTIISSNKSMNNFKEKTPETFFQLLLYLLKKIPAAFFKQLPMTILIGLITWVLHTVLLIGPNGGFNPGPNENIAKILALKGNKVNGALFWMIASMGMTMILKQVFSGDIVNLINKIITTPKYILNTFKKGEITEKVITSLFCGVVLFISLTFGNKYLNLVIGSVFYLALQNWRKNFLFVIFKYIWSDIQRWFFSKNKKIQINYNRGTAVYSGITLGFFIGGLLSNYKFIGNILVIGLIGFAVFKMNNEKKRPTATVVLIICSSVMFYLLSKKYIVFADDGGFQEAGGTFSRWIGSEGAFIAIIMGVFPGFISVIGSILSNLGIDISSFFPEDFDGVDGGEEEKEEEEETDKKIWIEILANPKGIKADGAEISWIYAKVHSSDPEEDEEELTSEISFNSAGRYSHLLIIGDPQYSSGYKAVNVSANIDPNESYPPAVKVSIVASVNTTQGTISKSVTISLQIPGELKLEMSTNPEKKSILPDGKAGIWVYARPIPNEKDNVDKKLLEEILDSIKFSSGGEGAAWADLSEPTYVDDWRCVYVQASNPDGSNTGNNAPKSFSIVANAAVGEKVISEKVSIELLPMPELEVDNSKLSFLSGAKGSITVKAQVKNVALDSQWSFRTVIKEMSKDLISITFDEEENTYATLLIEESGGSASGGQRSIVRGTIVIYADYEEITLERHISVYIASEGIFVSDRGRHSDGSFRLKADGSSKKEIGFTVYKWDEARKELVADRSYLDKLQLDFQTPDSDKAFELNCLNVAQPNASFTRISDTAVPVGYYEITTSKEIPGTGKTAFIKINASLDIEGKDTFTTQATLGLETINLGPGSEAWQVEYDACVRIINKYVPTEYREKLTSILETRKMTLDAAGMYVMKRKIWSIAEALMQGEGGQGYLEEAKWADRIVTVLEWWEWAGDLAFDAVAATFAGPVGAVGASIMKSMIISAINAYQEGKTASEWLWEQIKGFIVMGADMAVDPDRTAKAIGKAKAWALFVCYKFIYGLYEGKSIKDAIYGAAAAAGENVLGDWLNDRVKSSAKANGYKVYEVETAKDSSEDASKTKDVDSNKPKDADSTKTKESDSSKTNDMDNNKSTDSDEAKSKDGESSKPKDVEADKPRDTENMKDKHSDKPDDAKHKPKDKNQDSDLKDKNPDKDTTTDKDINVKDDSNIKDDSSTKDDSTTRDKDHTKDNSNNEDGKNKSNDKDNSENSKDNDTGKDKDRSEDSKNNDKSEDSKNGDKDSKDNKEGDGKDDNKNNDSKNPDKDSDTDDIRPGESKKIKTPVGEVTIAKNADGKPYMSESDVLKIKQDTQASRTLKNADPKVREAYNNTLKEKIYDPHDKNLTNWIKDNVDGMKDKELKVDDFRTPGKDYDPTDVNTDRDYRVLYKDKNGKWVEVPKEKWKDQSMEEFAKSSGYSEKKAREALHSEAERAEFDKLSDLEKKEKWAEMHHQTPTDRAHVEASKDYSDQGVDWKTGENISEPNINKVKKGEAKLQDPEGLGQMFEEKVDIYTRSGNAPEALAQAKKAVNTLNDVREGYSKNYDIGNLPAKLKKGMDIISETKSDMSATPEYIKNVETQLKDLGFKDIGDFMDKVSGQFTSLKWAVKK